MARLILDATTEIVIAALATSSAGALTITEDGKRAKLLKGIEEIYTCLAALEKGERGRGGIEVG